MSENWIRVAATAELLPGEFRIAWDGDVAIAVYNIDGDFYAVEDVCSHDGGELAKPWQAAYWRDAQPAPVDVLEAGDRLWTQVMADVTIEDRR